jgi:hypothetical protein
VSNAVRQQVLQQLDQVLVELLGVRITTTQHHSSFVRRQGTARTAGQTPRAAAQGREPGRPPETGRGTAGRGTAGRRGRFRAGRLRNWTSCLRVSSMLPVAGRQTGHIHMDIRTSCIALCGVRQGLGIPRFLTVWACTRAHGERRGSRAATCVPSLCVIGSRSQM